jgi:hypothetical protein
MVNPEREGGKLKETTSESKRIEAGLLLPTVKKRKGLLRMPASPMWAFCQFELWLRHGLFETGTFDQHAIMFG